MADQERAEILKTIEQAPFSAALGLKIESASSGIARLTLPFSLRNLNAGGPQAPIHGGAIASLVDAAACAAVWSLPETRRSATVSMTVNYGRLTSQTELAAQAEVRRAGRTLASVAVEVRDGSGALVADGLVTYKIA